MPDTEKKNVVTIEIDLDHYLNSHSKQSALESAIKSQISNTNLVSKLVLDFVNNTIKDEALTKLQERISAEIEKQYGNPKKIEDMVGQQFHNISRVVADVAKDKTDIIEKAVMKAMLQDGFQKRIAEQVENMIKKNVKSYMTSPRIMETGDYEEDFDF